MQDKKFSKKLIVIFSTAAIVLFLDQLTKSLVRINLQAGESIPIMGKILKFSRVSNTGAAFGILKGMNFAFILFSIFVLLMAFYFIKKIRENERAAQVAAGLLIGGTAGNLADRLIYGAVTDFIDFRIWPVFNIADSAVTIGVVILIILLWEK